MSIRNKIKNTNNEYEDEVLDSSYYRWISTQFQKRAYEYSDIQGVSLCSITWNINAKELTNPTKTLTTLLQLDLNPADIYVIGLQEMVDLNVMNIVINRSSSDDMALFWIMQLLEAFKARGLNYSPLLEKHMVGLFLVVFCKTDLVNSISDVRSSAVCTGGYGVTGNKGGVAIRFDLFDSSVACICAHFHANRNNVATRNLDYQTIADTLIFAPNVTRDKVPSNSNRKGRNVVSGLLQKQSNSPYNLNSHEHIFWCGDFNYRIGSELEDVEILQIVQQGDWPVLLKDDQLTAEQKIGNVFHNCEEGKITFPPTYKYQPGTNEYDTRAEKKLRAPAWCDRILFNSLNKSSTILQSYGALALNMSDHKPVFAYFNINARKINNEKAHSLYQELLFSIDKWVNASTPRLTVDNRIIDFGSIEDTKVYHAVITMTNPGNVLTEWKFVPKSEELLICKPWYKLSPEDGVLAPGESCSVEVTLKFTPELLFTIPGHTSKDQLLLEEIVILHIKNGNDYFCIFSAAMDSSTLTKLRKNVHQKVKTGKNLIPIDNQHSKTKGSNIDTTISSTQHSSASSAYPIQQPQSARTSNPASSIPSSAFPSVFQSMTISAVSESEVIKSQKRNSNEDDDDDDDDEEEIVKRAVHHNTTTTSHQPFTTVQRERRVSLSSEDSSESDEDEE